MCHSPNLVTLLDLGIQELSGFFPGEVTEPVNSFPLVLLKCDDFQQNGCGLVQLKYSCSPDSLYGNNYGYRSGLNPSMLNHLENFATKYYEQLSLKPGDFVLDIAGNDGSFLSFFPSNLVLLSIDPTSRKFSKFYPDHISWIDDFFSASIVTKFSKQKAKLVTSFSVFYDLEDPVEFARDVSQILDKDGVWAFEQSYVGSMLLANSFDTICHEHLLYYGIKQVELILEKVKMKVLEIIFTDTNGGSFCVTAAHQDSSLPINKESIETARLFEKSLALDRMKTWESFINKIAENEKAFHQILSDEIANGKSIAGLGASTKGNILLNHWGISRNEIKIIGDVNSDKFGKFTPGSNIPIVEEDRALDEYETFVVLPWHFKNFFIENPKFAGKRLIFPLPFPHLVVL
jgi:hypothetical protein